MSHAGGQNGGNRRQAGVCHWHLGGTTSILAAGSTDQGGTGDAPGSMSYLVEIGIVVCLLVLNGWFAMSELAIVSSRRPRLEALAERGVKGARVALELAAKPGHFLSSVQAGITLVGIFAGAYSGATLSDPFSDWLVSHYADTISGYTPRVCHSPEYHPAHEQRIFAQPLYLLLATPDLHCGYWLVLRYFPSRFAR